MDSPARECWVVSPGNHGAQSKFQINSRCSIVARVAERRNLDSPARKCWVGLRSNEVSPGGTAPFRDRKNRAVPPALDQRSPPTQHSRAGLPYAAPPALHICYSIVIDQKTCALTFTRWMHTIQSNLFCRFAMWFAKPNHRAHEPKYELPKNSALGKFGHSAVHASDAA